MVLGIQGEVPPEITHRSAPKHSPTFKMCDLADYPFVYFQEVTTKLAASQDPLADRESVKY